ncbi:MAG: DUF5011 domain-containing protein, partial [Parcubacteria group bacterium]|nr:DUF5011 domain-containing protein [Parcubacteria group bacterium]
RIGLIAEEAPTEILAKGGKGVDLYKLVTSVLSAFQTLAEKVEGVVAKVSGFAESFTTEELCVADQSGQKTCVTKAQLDALLAGQTNVEPVAITDTPETEKEEAPDTTPPTVTIIGANPAEIEVNATYSDNGAAVSDNVDSNLGYTTYVDGLLVTQIQLDTTSPRTYIIDYVATDNAGNTATSTREVIIGESAQEEEIATTTPEI